MNISVKREIFKYYISTKSDKMLILYCRQHKGGAHLYCKLRLCESPSNILILLILFHKPVCLYLFFLLLAGLSNWFKTKLLSLVLEAVSECPSFARLVLSCILIHFIFHSLILFVINLCNTNTYFQIY